MEKLLISIDKKTRIDMPRAAEIEEEVMRKWHTEFERRAPETHHLFLFALGITEDEILYIRKRSMEESPKEKEKGSALNIG